MTLSVEQAGLPRCANCGVEIPWPPASHRGKTYCCGGCVQGGPCYCSYDLASLHQSHGWPRQTRGVRARRALPKRSSKRASGDERPLPMGASADLRGI